MGSDVPRTCFFPVEHYRSGRQAGPISPYQIQNQQSPALIKISLFSFAPPISLLGHVPIPCQPPSNYSGEIWADAHDALFVVGRGGKVWAAGWGEDHEMEEVGSTAEMPFSFLDRTCGKKILFRFLAKHCFFTVHCLHQQPSYTLTDCGNSGLEYSTFLMASYGTWPDRRSTRPSFLPPVCRIKNPPFPPRLLISTPLLLPPSFFPAPPQSSRREEGALIFFFLWPLGVGVCQAAPPDLFFLLFFFLLRTHFGLPPTFTHSVFSITFFYSSQLKFLLSLPTPS